MKLKHLFQLAFVSLFLFVGSVTASADDIENSSIANYNDLAYSYYPNGTFSGYGTISGAGKVYMVLTIQGESVSGKYYYVKTNKNRKNKAWIYISGYYAYEADEDCVLQEHASGPKSGGFYGGLYSLNNNYTRFSYESKFHRNDGRSFNFKINLK